MYGKWRLKKGAFSAPPTPCVQNDGEAAAGNAQCVSRTGSAAAAVRSVSAGWTVSGKTKVCSMAGGRPAPPLTVVSCSSSPGATVMMTVSASAHSALSVGRVLPRSSGAPLRPEKCSGPAAVATATRAALQKRVLVCVFPMLLCLSRACLGKMTMFNINGAKRRVSLPDLLGADACCHLRVRLFELGCQLFHTHVWVGELERAHRLRKTPLF